MCTGHQATGSAVLSQKDKATPHSGFLRLPGSMAVPSAQESKARSSPSAVAPPPKAPHKPSLPPSSGEWGSRGGGKGGAACWPVQISARRWDFAHFAHPCSQLPAHVAWPSCRHPSGSIVPDGLVSVFRGDPGWILAFLGDWNWEESPLAFHQSWVQISF